MKNRKSILKNKQLIPKDPNNPLLMINGMNTANPIVTSPIKRPYPKKNTPSKKRLIGMRILFILFLHRS